MITKGIRHYQLVRVPIGKARNGKQKYHYLIYEAISFRRGANTYSLLAVADLPETGTIEEKTEAWMEYREMEPMAQVFGEVEYHEIIDKFDTEGRYFLDLDDFEDHTNDDKIIYLNDYRKA